MSPEREGRGKGGLSYCQSLLDSIISLYIHSHTHSLTALFKYVPIFVYFYLSAFPLVSFPFQYVARVLLSEMHL